MLRRPASRFAALIAAITVAVIAACGRDANGPTGPLADASYQAHVIGAGGHFAFLPPIAPTQSFSGTPDPTLSPRVQICEWAAGACVTTVANFTATSGTGGELVKYQASGNNYAVNWKTSVCTTGPCSLKTDASYRLRVFVGAVELGFADVVVAKNGSGLKNLNTSETIGLVDGQTLPVKFRIEQGAVTVVPPGGSATVGTGGAQVTAADGSVALDISAGALPLPTPISITTVTNPPEGAEPWGPVIDLGPDGTTFSAPVTLTVAYDPAALPAGASIDDLVIWTLVDGAWEMVPGSTVNAADHTISAPLSHFSMYRPGFRAYVTTSFMTPTTFAVGETATLAATACTQIGQGTCQPARNARIGWLRGPTSDPNAVTGPVNAPASNVTNSQGVATGDFRGLSPGTVVVYAALEGVTTTSTTVTLTVRPRLQVSHVLKSDQDVETVSQSPTRDAGYHQYFSALVDLGELSAAPVNLTITHTNHNVATGFMTVTVPANSSRSDRTNVLAEGIGRDTMIVSAPTWGRDTLIIDVDFGALHVQGLPAQLAYDDSALVRVWYANPLETSMESTAYQSPILATSSAELLLKNGATVGTPGCFTPTRCNFQNTSTVTPYFWVKGVAAGTATLTLQSGLGAPPKVVSVVVLPPPNPPSIGISPNTIGINVQQGSSVQTTVQVTNGGGGTLDGLEVSGFSDFHIGGAYQWITATLDRTTAPATITITAAPDLDVFPQNYRVRFTISAPGATPNEFVFHSIFVNVTPFVIPPIPSGAEVVAGGKSSCMREESGSVFCWGESSYDATAAPGGTFSSIGSGFFHYCGIRTDQTLACWGSNSDLMSEPPAGQFKSIAVASESNCAIRLDDTAACWGFSNDGRVSVPPGTYSQIGLGWYHGCGVRKTDATMVCWGRNDQGQATAQPGTFRMVTGGQSHSCAIRTNLTLVCFGASPAPPSGQFLSVSASMGGHTCAIRVDYTVACWGQNDFGQANPPSGQFRQVSAGWQHSCGVRLDGTPVCWGWDGTGAVTISRWSTPTSMPTPRWGTANVTIGSKIYMIGGNANNDQPYPPEPVSSVVEVYDAATNTWTRLADLPRPLEHMMAAQFQNKILVFGGWLCNLCGNDQVWVYDIPSNTWSFGGNTPTFMYGGTVNDINGVLFISTGNCCGSPAGGFFAYNPSSQVWTQLASMPRAHVFPAASGVIGGKIYMVGGEGANGTTSMYDPVLNTWTTRATMPVNRQHGAGVVLNGYLYAVGGENDGAGDRRDVYRYDPNANSWAMVSQMPVARNLNGASVINGAIYVFGGTGQPNPPGAPIGRVDVYRP